jgi:hypothetical protein
MIATHDSLTAYPVKINFLRPFNFLCKTQDKTLKEQYDAGARSFDLRFAYYAGDWYAAHGAMIYDITIHEVFRALVWIGEPVYFRVLCEDTFYKKSDAQELASIVDDKILYYKAIGAELILKPLYIRSKRTWELIREYDANKDCADYPALWDKTYTPSGMANAIDLMHTTQTSDDKLNFVACYSSKFIPRLTAKILTRIALKKKWKENDVPVVDFI